MKKRMSRILSALLVSALVMSAGNVVQAEDAGESVPGKPKVEDGAITQQSAEAQEIGAMSVPDAAKDLSAQATVSGSIPLKKMITGTESIDDGYITYSNTSNFRKGKDYYYGYSQQVSLTKGTLVFAVSGISGQRIYFGLYKDAGLTQCVDSFSFTDVGSVRSETFQVPGPGTYYLGIYSSIYTSTRTPEGSVRVEARAAACFYDGSERTLTSGKQIAVGAKSAQTTYFKFKVKKAGYITVQGDDTARYYDATLCNSKKKALSGVTDLGYGPTYGVKKGTYYIKVNSSYNSAGAYALKVTSNSSIKEKSGKSRAKAVTIKRKATKKGTIQAGSSQADWYKFKKTNKNKAVVTIKGRTNDKMKITVYRGGKKIGSGTFTYRYKAYTFTMTNYSKGTYYVKIERGNRKSSGWYSINWK